MSRPRKPENLTEYVVLRMVGTRWEVLAAVAAPTQEAAILASARDSGPHRAIPARWWPTEVPWVNVEMVPRVSLTAGPPLALVEAQARMYEGLGLDEEPLTRATARTEGPSVAGTALTVTGTMTFTDEGMQWGPVEGGDAAETARAEEEARAARAFAAGAVDQSADEAGRITAGRDEIDPDDIPR